MERKVKYDYAFKLECVELVLKKHYSDRYVSKFKHIPRWNIRKGVSFYKTYGEIGNPFFLLFIYYKIILGGSLKIW
jgi:transposase